MRYIFFDTETNGLPLTWNAKMTDLDNWPRITQLAWVISDGDVSIPQNLIIKPDGWTVPKEKFFLENNITTERCEAEGIPMKEALEIFIEDTHWSDCLVSHNMAFDYNVLGAEMIRYGKSTGKRMTQICTKEASTECCKLPGPRGYKWPKLIELHRHLFNCDFDGAHDAMSDVYALEKCFWELHKRKIINP